MRIRKREGRIALSRISTGCHRMLDDVSMGEDRAWKEMEWRRRQSIKIGREILFSTSFTIRRK